MLSFLSDCLHFPKLLGRWKYELSQEQSTIHHTLKITPTGVRICNKAQKHWGNCITNVFKKTKNKTLSHSFLDCGLILFGVSLPFWLFYSWQNCFIWSEMIVFPPLRWFRLSCSLSVLIAAWPALFTFVILGITKCLACSKQVAVHSSDSPFFLEDHALHLSSWCCCSYWHM